MPLIPGTSPGDMDARNKSGHDERSEWARVTLYVARKTLRACGTRDVARGTFQARATHHGPVHGAGRVRQYGGIDQETSRGASHAMQDDTQQSTTVRTFGRSTVDRLPPGLRQSVDAAIAGGATLDEIGAHIRAHGHNCSRSAIGRYAKRLRVEIRRLHDARQAIQMWADALGERAEDCAGLIASETLRTLARTAIDDVDARREAVTIEEVARLALAVQRVESTEGLRLERQRAAAKAPAPVGRMRRESHGADAAGPVASHGAHPVPYDAGGSRKN